MLQLCVILCVTLSALGAYTFCLILDNPTYSKQLSTVGAIILTLALLLTVVTIQMNECFYSPGEVNTCFMFDKVEEPVEPCSDEVKDNLLTEPESPPDHGFCPGPSQVPF